MNGVPVAMELAGERVCWSRSWACNCRHPQGKAVTLRDGARLILTIPPPHHAILSTMVDQVQRVASRAGPRAWLHMGKVGEAVGSQKAYGG